jgi:2-isopropylmalate synthase
LISFATQARTGAEGSATVCLAHQDGRSIEKQASGDGPVDACFKAIEQAAGLNLNLRKYEVRSVSEGEDAQGEALVYVEYNGRTYRGSSVSTNIIESSARAFLEVINRVELSRLTGAKPLQERREDARAAQAAV